MEEEEVELVDEAMAGVVEGWMAAQRVVATKHSWDVGFSALLKTNAWFGFSWCYVESLFCIS